MQKYISVSDESDIRYYDLGVDVSQFINLDDYREMSEEEVRKHETPKVSAFHTVWDGSSWIDPRTEEEKVLYKRSQYPSLTRYQFLRCLLESGYKSKDIEDQIMTIEDEFVREITLLGFKEATKFVRTDESVLLMQHFLGFTDEQVDQMWEKALTL